MNQLKAYAATASQMESGVPICSRVEPVLGCHTLEGSKPLRQFVDCKSDRGVILTRLHSCHDCEGCRTPSDYRIEYDADGNASIPANTTCKNMEICGPVEAYQLFLPSAAVIQPLTRSYFAKGQGARLTGQRGRRHRRGVDP